MKYGNISAFVDLESFNNAEGISTTFFYYGCNFSCGYCHNHKMLTETKVILDENKLETILKHAKRNWVSTIVITGGEPTLDKNLTEFLKYLKQQKFKIKLDTNGSRPKIINSLINQNLVDYFAMDVKGTKDQYQEITKYNNIDNINESINLIKNSNIDYEFRTTVIPKHHNEKEILEIGKWLNYSKKYVLQQFQPNLKGGCLNKEYEKMITYNNKELNKLKKIAKPFFKEVIVKCK